MADKKNPKQPLQEEDVIARLKSASGGDLAGLTTYTGLLGRSSKEGYWLLYPTLDMSTSIEIQEPDIVHSEPLPPEQSPFGGLGGTLVFVRKGAQVTTMRTLSRTSQAGAGDEFDLDIRVAQPGDNRSSIILEANTEAANCTELCPTFNTCRTDCWTSCDCISRRVTLCARSADCNFTDTCETCRDCTRTCTNNVPCRC